MRHASRCNKCGQVWAVQDLAPIPAERKHVAPSGVVPLGACPNTDCQALCYPAYGYVYTLEQQCIALQDIVSRLLDWAAAMGGWEAPVWDQARRALASSRRSGGKTMLEADALTDQTDDLL
jgi:hypothetical protein